MTVVAGILVKTTIILLCVTVLSWTMKRASASARHAVWIFGFLAILAFPVVSTFPPSVTLPILPVESPFAHFEAGEIANILAPQASDTVVAAEDRVRNAESPVQESPEVQPQSVTAVPQAAAPSAPWNWTLAGALLWTIGSVIVFARWVVAVWMLRGLWGRSERLESEDWQSLLRELKPLLGVFERVDLRMASEDVPPMTSGILRPVIFLPTEATTWSATRRRLVLAHELAHIRRKDGLGQILTQCVCSLYWFNPLVWYAAARLRTDREHACDDSVLRLGAAPADYADHLLQIARRLNTGFLPSAVSMAHRSQLKSRVLAILDARMPRRVLSRAVSAALLLLVGALTLSTAAIQVTAMASMTLPALAAPFGWPMSFGTAPQTAVPSPGQTGSIEGRILDAVTGDPVEDVDISIPQPNSQDLVVATSDGKGRFTIEGLTQGTHQLETRKEGYVSVRAEGRKAPGSPGAWITVAAGSALKDVVFRLRRAGVVTGRIFDTRGRPVVRATVLLDRASYDAYGKRFTKTLNWGATNDRGEFRVFGIDAGEYYLRAQMDDHERGWATAPPGGETFEEAYYPGVPELAKAARIKIDWGTEVRLADLTLQPVKVVPVRMRIVNETGEPEGAVRSVGVYRNGELLLGTFGSRQSSGGAGRLEIAGLPPGTYDIAVGWGGNDKMGGTRTTLEVNGAEVTGDLFVRKAPVVSGRFLLQNADGTARPIAASMRLEKNSFQLATLGSAEGDFTIPGVPPEEYNVRFGRLPAGAYVLAMRQDGTAVPADRVRVEKDTRLEILFSLDAGTVQGSVRDSKGEPVPGALVTLIPDAPLRSHGHLYRNGAADQNGNVTIHGIAPGAYRMFAWLEMEGGAYRNAEFMRPFEERGAAVEVTAHQTSTANIRLADEETDR